MTRSRRLTAWRLLIVLVAASAVAVLLPTSITGRLRSLVQVFAPFQDGIARVTGGRSPAGDRDPSGSRAMQAMRSTIETLASQNRRLRLDNEMLTRVRQRGLGRRGRLIPARVVAEDAAYWRASRLILSGTRSGVFPDAGVISRHFVVDVDGPQGTRAGMAVLAGEVLIGVIESAGAHTSHVKLLSDPDTRMPVAVGRVEETMLYVVDAAFWLVGVGGGVIEIRDVHHNYVDDGSVRLGDIVLTRDDDNRLPPSVTIGDITKVTPHPNNSLLYTLEVTPRIDLNQIRRVYVVDIDF